MRLESVRIDGRTTEHTHELGVLTVQDPHPGTEEDRVLSVVARGIPDPMFAYLDSAVEVDDFDALGVNLLYLGAEASLFESDYVALMPGVHWMPTPGPAIPSSRPPHRRAYALDRFNTRYDNCWFTRLCWFRRRLPAITPLKAGIAPTRRSALAPCSTFNSPQRAIRATSPLLLSTGRTLSFPPRAFPVQLSGLSASEHRSSLFIALLVRHSGMSR